MNYKPYRPLSEWWLYAVLLWIVFGLLASATAVLIWLA